MVALWQRAYTPEIREAIANRTWPDYGPFPAPAHPVLWPAAMLARPDGSRNEDGTIEPDLGTVWETTQLLVNPSVETNLTSLQATAGLTMTRVTDAATDGIASVRIVGGAGSATKRLLWYNVVPVSIAGAYDLTAAVDLWGTGTVTVDISGEYSDLTTYAGSASASVVLSGTPQRVTAPTMRLNTSKTVAYVRLSVRLVSDTADFRADAASLTIGEDTQAAGTHVVGDAWRLVSGTTNLISNGSVEYATTGTQVSSGLTLTHDTGEGSEGNASVHVVAPSGSAGKRLLWENAVSPVVTGATYVIGAVDVWGTGTVDVEVSGTYSDATSWASGGGSDTILTGTPQRISSPIKAVDPAKSINLIRISVWVRSGSADFNADAAQAEVGQEATPFVSTVRPDATVTLTDADLAVLPDPLDTPDFRPDRTIAFVGDIHTGKTGVAARLAAIEDDMIAINSDIAHRVYVGDLTESFGSIPSEITNAQAWIASVGPTGAWDVIAGNHDYGGPGVQPDGDAFAASWGYAERHWTRDMGDFVLIGLNQREHGNIGVTDTWMNLFPEDLDYLDDALGATPKDCIIVFHAPLWDTVSYGTFPSSDTRYGANPDADIKAILDTHDNARMWVSGHTHTSTDDPNIFMELPLATRSILTLNCSGIAYVAGATTGISSAGPLYAPVVTIENDRVWVRWRDHENATWATVQAAAYRSIPEGPGHIVIQFTEDGVTKTAAVAGSGGFGRYGEITVAGSDITLGSRNQTDIAQVMVFGHLPGGRAEEFLRNRDGEWPWPQGPYGD